jgi:hypothetical protein
MFSNKIQTLLMLAVIILCAAGGARAQDRPAAEPTPTPREVSPAVNNAFRRRVFELKHRDPDSLMRALQPLASGTHGSTYSISRELKTITLRDFPENIALIEEAINRLDRPEAAQQGIEFHIHILIASNNNAGASKPFPAELNDVIKQLQTTLSYKNYNLMSSDVLRAKVGPGGVSNKGVAELRLSPETTTSNNPIFYEYRLSRISAEAGAAKVQVEEFIFSMRVPLTVSSGTTQYENIGFATPVTVREGEKVVVGTTSMQDKGLVIVLTASIVK